MKWMAHQSGYLARAPLAQSLRTTFTGRPCYNIWHSDGRRRCDMVSAMTLVTNRSGGLTSQWQGVGCFSAWLNHRAFGKGKRWYLIVK